MSLSAHHSIAHSVPEDSEAYAPYAPVSTTEFDDIRHDIIERALHAEEDGSLPLDTDRVQRVISTALHLGDISRKEVLHLYRILRKLTADEPMRTEALSANICTLQSGQNRQCTQMCSTCARRISTLLATKNPPQPTVEPSYS
jgi:hypothetical protein